MQLCTALQLYSTFLVDVENVMSVGSAARVKFQSWVQILALKIHCFVKNSLFVYCNSLYWTSLQLTARNWTSLNLTALHCTSLHLTALHCASLHLTCTEIYFICTSPAQNYILSVLKLYFTCTALYFTCTALLITCTALHFTCTALQFTCTVLHFTWTSPALHYNSTALHYTSPALNCTSGCSWPASPGPSTTLRNAGTFGGTCLFNFWFFFHFNQTL